MSQTRIQVGIRVRQFLEHEKKNGYKNCKLIIQKEDREVKLQLDDTRNNFRTFKFDHVFNESCQQQDVYNGCNIDNYINKVIEGYHATIFAYGQTGSGKTYTMEGFEYDCKDGNPKPKIQQNRDNFGLIPRAIYALFSKIKQKSSQRMFNVYCSFLQIYNEKIYDLLNPSTIKVNNIGEAIAYPTGLRLRWNQRDQFSVENLFVFECKSAEEVMEYFCYGIKNRINSSHKLNLQSSRSHTILTLRVDSLDLETENVLSSKLELVDLAGSERIGQTGSDGRLAKESIDINKSLFILRQVITTLAEINKNQKTNAYQHIPYRESKLTCLLKQSIGGNCYCLMLACIVPADNFFEENVSTLNYAMKTTYIYNEPVKNDDPKSQVIRDMKTEIKRLKEELNKANTHIQFLSQLTSNSQNCNSNNNNLDDVENRHCTEFKDQKQQLAQQQQRPNTHQSNRINRTQIKYRSCSRQSIDSQLQETLYATKCNEQSQQKTNFSHLQNIQSLNNDEQNQQQLQFQQSKQNMTRQSFRNTSGKINQSLAMQSNIDYEHFSGRLIESITMVRELLQSNKELREQTEDERKKQDECQIELISLQKENQDLREKLQILQQQAQEGQGQNNIKNSRSLNNNLTNQFFQQNNLLLPSQQSQQTQNDNKDLEEQNNETTQFYLQQKIEESTQATNVVCEMQSQQLTENQLLSPQSNELYNMNKNDLINLVLSLKSDNKAIQQQLKGIDLKKSFSVNRSTKQQSRKQLPNNQSAERDMGDSLLTNFGRYTFYQNLNSQYIMQSCADDDQNHQNGNNITQYNQIYNQQNNECYTQEIKDFNTMSPKNTLPCTNKHQYINTKIQQQKMCTFLSNGKVPRKKTSNINSSQNNEQSLIMGDLQRYNCIRTAGSKLKQNIYLQQPQVNIRAPPLLPLQNNSFSYH